MTASLEVAEMVPGATFVILFPPLLRPVEVRETVPEVPPVIVTPFVLMTVVVDETSGLLKVALCMFVRS